MRLEARTVAAFGVLALGLANLGRFPGGAVGGRESPLILADVAVALVWFFLVAAVLTGRVRPAIDRVTAAVLLFVGAAAISTLLAIARYDASGAGALGIVAYLLRWIAYFGWYPFVTQCLTRDEAGWTWHWLERAILLFCIFGIVQSAFMPGFAQMIHSSDALPDWDKQGRRLVSTVLDPNFAGIFIVIALLSRLARLTEGEREHGLTLGILATGLLLTVSRSSILALMAGIFVLGVTRGLRLRVLKLFLAGGLLLLPFLSLLIAFAQGFNKLGFDPSAAQRLIPWFRGILLIRDHPLLGVGFNALAAAQEARGWRLVGGADTSFDGGLLFIAVMTGLVGLFLYVRILHRVWAWSRMLWRDAGVPARERAHASATVASMGAVIVHSLFVNSLLLPFVMQILWIMWARLAHAVRAQRTRAALVAAPLLLVIAGCDPCAGTISCTRSGDIAVTGGIVNHRDGTAIPGARVDARFVAGGEELVRTTTTDADGQWALRVPMPGDEPVTAWFTVTSPGQSGYEIAALPVRRLSVAGDAHHLGLWGDVPFARIQPTLLNRGVPLTSARVTFERTGGVPAELEAIPDPSNGAGIVHLEFVGSEVGTAYGTLRVTHATSVGDPPVYENFPVPIGYRWELPVPFPVEVGGRLAYAGSIFDLGTGEYVAGATFSFVRTGGIVTTPSSVAVTSGAGGFFIFELVPRTRGEVVGNVSIRPPGKAAQAYPGVRFVTYDSSEVRHTGVWLYGQAWRWYADIRNADGSPAASVPVTFRRVSGVTIAPAVIAGQTNADGRVWFGATTVTGTGEVVGDLVVSPAGRTPQSFTGLRLRTNPDYTYHPAGVFQLGAATSP